MLQLRACGDTGFVVAFATQPSRTMTQRMAALRNALLRSPPPGLIDILPGLVTLTFIFDPDLTSAHALVTIMEECTASPAGAPSPPRSWSIPVCYDASLAPDLDDVVGRCGVSKDEIAALHSEREYTVYLIGFSPGFPYLGDIAERLKLPRRAHPRTRVPAGSVAIADRYTAIYPQETPGGWHIIGRTAVSLFDAERTSPSLLQSGDSVRFRPVSRTEFDDLAARVASGVYVLPGSERSP